MKKTKKKDLAVHADCQEQPLIVLPPPADSPGGVRGEGLGACMGLKGGRGWGLGLGFRDSGSWFSVWDLGLYRDEQASVCLLTEQSQVCTMPNPAERCCAWESSR